MKIQMQTLRLLSLTVGMLLGCETFAACVQEGQWGSKILGFSSQFSATQWAAAKILGPCDIDAYGDNDASWSGGQKDNGLEWIEVEFPEAVYPSGVIIRENYGPGAIRKIELQLTDGTYRTVWAANSYDYKPKQVNDSRFTWEPGGDLCKVVKVTIDTNHVKDEWETLDSIQLLGPPTVD